VPSFISTILKNRPWKHFGIFNIRYFRQTKRSKSPKSTNRPQTLADLTICMPHMLDYFTCILATRNLSNCDEARCWDWTFCGKLYSSDHIHNSKDSTIVSMEIRWRGEVLRTAYSTGVIKGISSGHYRGEKTATVVAVPVIVVAGRLGYLIWW
jgi:hypothetical protein